ncbi:HOG (high osmolarity glycerol) pathway protein [Actinomortierella wolfii]|nr:HOG (high osmolarity glycerol) pathway protein [Actinomortierella wolfii]
MIMAPVSLPSCNSRRSPRDPDIIQANAKKRNSVHFLEDVSSTLSKRISLYSGVRSRSFSESWVFMLPDIPDSGMLLSRCSTATPSTSSTDSSTAVSNKKLSSLKPSRADTTPAQCTPIHEKETAAEPDHNLMASLASFLERGCPRDPAFDDENENQGANLASAQKEEPQTAGPVEDDEETDLVIMVRDFAYPPDHPYHFGKYPPPPAYEESDIEEEEPYEDEYDDYSSSPHTEPVEERTSGQSRGLYDFDAENASELSFREGDILWIHCRQFPGWFLGEMGGVVGLVPENYVQML